MSRCNCQILAIPKERRRIHPAPNQRFKTGLLLGYDNLSKNINSLLYRKYADYFIQPVYDSFYVLDLLIDCCDLSCHLINRS